MKTSIILLCKDRWDQTRRCLAAVKRHTAPGTYELLVFDNASSDATPARLAALAKTWPALKVRRNRENLPFSRAVNEGMRRAKGEFLVWLNNDAEVGPGWLEGLRTAAVRDPSLGAVGPRTDRQAPPEQLRPLQGNAGVRRATFLGGFCLLLRREAVERTGLLDERFVWGWEDVDYCLRLRQGGWKLGLAQGVFVRHAGGRTMRRLPAGDRSRTDSANRRLLLEKWVDAEPYFSEITGLLRSLPEAPAPLRAIPLKNPPLLSVAVYRRRGEGPPDPACLKALRGSLNGLRHEVLAFAPLGQVERHLRAWRPRHGRRDWPQLKLFPHPGAGPLPWLVNLLWGKARGKHLVALSDDVRPSPGLFEELSAGALRTANTGAVGPLTNGTMLPWQKGPPGSLGDFRPAHYLREFCLMIPKAVFERHGFFDERFRLGVWGTDYCLRLRHAGYQVLVAAGALARRRPGPDWGLQMPTGIPDGEASDAKLLFEKWGGHPLFERAR